MQLTDEDIREFSEIWQIEFNETLSSEQARTSASQLITLYTLMFEPKEE
jgi:flagellin-specific chaperone FliS